MKTKIILLLFLLNLAQANQSLFKKNIDKYDHQIIKIINNAKIQNFNSDNLDWLKAKISERKDIKIKIFGDSHTAPDIFSSEIRNDLFKPSAVGFVYPLFPRYHRNLLTQYNSSFFEVINSLHTNNLDYPMGGVIARAKNIRAQISLDVLLEHKNFITNFVFQSPKALAAFEITDSNGKKIILGSKNAQTWEISKDYELRYPITIKALIPNAKLGGYFIYNKQDNNLIDHMGINGARSDLWLKWNQSIMDKELQIIQYDLVILSYGSNDAFSKNFDPQNFTGNYKVLIRKIRKYNPNAVILLVAPPTVVSNKNSKKYEIVPNFYSVKQAIKKLAIDEKTLLFDMDDLMEKTGKKNKWIEMGLSKHDVHLTPLGYRTIGNAIYKSLIEILKIKE